MPDSDALRSRRKRLHAAGDCSLCRHDRPGGVVVPPVAGDAGMDPQSMLEALARRLEAASEADPGNDRVARELRATLLVLDSRTRDASSVDDDPLAELRRLDPSLS
jgi:hypothetical protein